MRILYSWLYLPFVSDSRSTNIGESNFLNFYCALLLEIVLCDKVTVRTLEVKSFNHFENRLCSLFKMFFFIKHKLLHVCMCSAIFEAYLKKTTIARKCCDGGWEWWGWGGIEGREGSMEEREGVAPWYFTMKNADMFLNSSTKGSTQVAMCNI